jgi:predicted small metal-binding protein
VRKEVKTMAYSFACKDAGVGCPGIFRVETEDELMQHLELHAKVAHPDIEMTPDTVRQFKSVIKKV